MIPVFRARGTPLSAAHGRSLLLHTVFSLFFRRQASHYHPGYVLSGPLLVASMYIHRGSSSMARRKIQSLRTQRAEFALLPESIDELRK